MLNFTLIKKNLNSQGHMRTLNLFIFSVLIIPITSFSQTGPGGVGDSTINSLWLKADQGTSTNYNNDSVTSWQDCSGNGYLMSQSTPGKRPIFIANSFNGYPAIKFSKTGTKNHLLYGTAEKTDSTRGITIFSVVQKNGTGVDARSIISKRTNVNTGNSFMFFFFTGNKLYVDYENITDRLSTDTSFLNNKIIISSMFDGSLPELVRSTIYSGNKLIKIAKETSTSISLNTSPVIIGATNTTDPRAFDGEIAEVITYRIALNQTQRTIVNNYLSAKYDISLTQLDLYKMDDGINGDFDHEVAGIGWISPIDNHVVAQGSGIVEISNASNLSDKFLFWGHNNGAPRALNGSDVPPTVQARFDRKWRVSSNTKEGVASNVGTISMQFDLTGLGNVDASDLRLLKSSNGTFSTSTVISGATLVSGNLYRFDDVALNDGDFFTLGTINSLITPLPITLLDFNADKERKSVRLNWRTAS
jgi:hypothetical protein